MCCDMGDAGFVPVDLDRALQARNGLGALGESEGFGYLRTEEEKECGQNEAEQQDAANQDAAELRHRFFSGCG
jgi:hypothetical protein